MAGFNLEFLKTNNFKYSKYYFQILLSNNLPSKNKMSLIECIQIMSPHSTQD